MSSQRAVLGFNACELCGAFEKLLVCSRCKSAFYCSKVHQRAHWKSHKPRCSAQSEAPKVRLTVAADRKDSPVFIPPQPEVACLSSGIGDGGKIVLNRKYYGDGQRVCVASHGVNKQEGSSEKDILQSSAEELTPRFSIFADQATNVSAPVHWNGDLKVGLGKKSQMNEERTVDIEIIAKSAGKKQYAGVSKDTSKVNILPPFLHLVSRNSDTGLGSCQFRDWIAQVCQHVINDLDRYGVCVVDNFLGEEKGLEILKEVKEIHRQGIFKDGQLVSSKQGERQTIRGDKIAWVDGTEPENANVGILISVVDSVVMNANKMKGCGKLGNYRINGRSKAMVACYPGNGTHYVKHVDNPNKDGRCVTAIYYINKDWDVKVHGGLLRIFPEGWTNQVADIEPIFDRIVFFWSDRRNPHEVQPSFETRYAVTLWYFDAKEREKAQQCYAEGSQQ